MDSVSTSVKQQALSSQYQPIVRQERFMATREDTCSNVNHIGDNYNVDARLALTDTSTSGGNNYSYLLCPEDNPHSSPGPSSTGPPVVQIVPKAIAHQDTLASMASTAVPTPTPTRRHHPPRPHVPHRHPLSSMSTGAQVKPEEAVSSPDAAMIPGDPFADSPISSTATTTTTRVQQVDLVEQLRNLMANAGNSELVATKLAAITATASNPPTPLRPPPTATTGTTQWHPLPPSHRHVPPPLRLSHNRQPQVLPSATPPNTATSPRSWSARPVPPPKRQMSSSATHQKGGGAREELHLPQHAPPPVPPSPAASAVSHLRGGWRDGPPPVTPARKIAPSMGASDELLPANIVSPPSHELTTLAVPGAPAPGSANAPVSPSSLSTSLSLSSDAATVVHAPENGAKQPLPKEQRRTSSAAALRDQQVKRYTSKLEKEKKALLDHIHEASSTAHSLSSLLSQAHAHNDSLLRSLEDREVALDSAERTLAKRDRQLSQLTAQLKSAQSELESLAVRLENTTHMLNDVQIAAHQQVQAVSEDRDRQVEQWMTEMQEVGERWQDKVREVEAKLACKDAAVAVVQAQRREVVELWGEVVKVVVGMVKTGGMMVDTEEVDVGVGGNDVGQEDLSCVLRSGAAVTDWLTRTCGQVTSTYKDVCEQLRAMAELADTRHVRITDLESELKQTVNQLDATRAELNGLQSADSQLTQSLRTELASVSADRDSLHADLTTLRHQLAATANERDQFSTDLARLHAELADAKSNHARMAGDLAMAKKLLEAERKYRRDHSAVQAELADVQSQLAQVQAERAADQQQLADEQSRRKAETGQLMAAVVEAQREVALLREKLALVQGGGDAAGLLRSASRPASPTMSMATTSVPAPPPLLSTSGKTAFSEGANHAPSPADSLSSTIARLQQRLNRSGHGELGSTASSPSTRAAGI